MGWSWTARARPGRVPIELQSSRYDGRSPLPRARGAPRASMYGGGPRQCLLFQMRNQEPPAITTPSDPAMSVHWRSWGLGDVAGDV